MGSSGNLVRFEGDALELFPHGGQWRAWNSDRRFVFVLAGTQGGKTSFGPWWLAREVERCGGGDYLAVTSSYDLFKLKMLPALRETLEHILKVGRYWAGDKLIELRDPETGKFHAKRQDDPMWGRVILRSAASGGGLESATAKAAWLDECGQDEFTLETWEAVLRRLSLARGRVLGTTTPYQMGWVKREVYDRWTAGDSDFEVVQFESALNPAFPLAEQERAERTMPGWRFRMFYKGQFTKPAGMIYDCFDEVLHVCKPKSLPPQWPRYVGADFGGVNTALLWIAEDPATRKCYVYRESLDGGKTTREHAEAARKEATGINFVAAWGGAKSEEQQRADWSDRGFQIREPPISDVEAGIARVYALLKEKRLQVFDSCRGLLDEFGTYRRKLDASGQPTEVIEDKRIFHRLDALRYVASGLSRPAPSPPAVGGPRAKMVVPGIRR